MNDGEKYIFEEVLMDFFRTQPSLQDAPVNITNIKVDHQEVVAEKRDLCSGGQRSMASVEGAKTIGITAGVSTDVRTVVKRDSSLPPDVTDVLLYYVIRENKAALINLLRAESLPYFDGIRDISRRVAALAVKEEVEATAERNDKDRDVDSSSSTGSALNAALIAVPWILLAFAILCLAKTYHNQRKNKRTAQDQTDG